MMRSGEMCDALLNGGIGEKTTLDGTTKDLVEAMRFFKGGKMKLHGLIELNQANYKGTDIRKIDLSDAEAVFNLFNGFTADIDKCRRPVFDEKHNGIVATDGWKMLAIRMPPALAKDKAVECGFTDEPLFDWQRIVDEMEPSDYNLSYYRRMATIREGSEKHGLLQAVREAVSAYAHDDGDGCLNTLRLKIGKKFYDAHAVANTVDALFGLGCGTVGLCEQTAFNTNHVLCNTPLHVYGFGCAVDAAKGVVKPLCDADDSTGAFVMPLDGTGTMKEMP